MTGRARCRLAAAVLVALVPFATTRALAAEPPVPTVAAHQEGAAAKPEEPESEGPVRFETELVASTIFQSGLLSLRLGSPLVLDAHWFGVDGTDAGVFGLAWEFRRGGWRVLPGLGWGVTEGGRPTPGVMVRWAFDSDTWISQGVLSLALRAQTVEGEGGEASHESEAETRQVYRHVLDGVHVSRVVGAFEVGPLIEQIRYREEKEWKGGARVAWRAGRGVKVVTQLVAPDLEGRIGLAWELR